MSSNFIRPDYGDYITQHREWKELCGLEDPADRYDPPAGPATLFVTSTRYPIDEAA